MGILNDIGLDEHKANRGFVVKDVAVQMIKPKVRVKEEKQNPNTMEPQ